MILEGLPVPGTDLAKNVESKLYLHLAETCNDFQHGLINHSGRGHFMVAVVDLNVAVLDVAFVVLDLPLRL